MIPPAHIPAPEGKAFLPYQLEGILFALKRRGTLIADEQGLGKTIQAIGIINAEPTIQQVVIVCPASLVMNWRSELNEWCTRLDDVLITITSYGQIHKLKDTYIDLLIVDESHMVSGEKAQRTVRTKKLAKMAKRVALLTGTPISNRPLDLWTQLQIACPESWDPAVKVRVLAPLRSSLIIHGNTATKKPRNPGQGEGNGFFKFAKQYCGARKEWRGNKSFWVFTGASNLDELQSKLRETCMIRRLKKDVLSQLPEKRRQIVMLGQQTGKHPSEGWMQDLTVENYVETIEKLYADPISFRLFSRIRHEQAVDKIDLALDHIRMVLENVDKVIVFAHHRDVVKELHEDLAKTYRCAMVHGETPPDARQAQVEFFQQDKDCRVFIGSIHAAGVGFTLTAASHEIFVELDPVPGRMNQAEDRAHRIGQKNSVLVQHLVLDGSIDARIAKILVQKQDVITAALDALPVIPENYGNEPTEVKYQNVKYESQAKKSWKDWPAKLAPDPSEELQSHENRVLGFVSGGHRRSVAEFLAEPETKREGRPKLRKSTVSKKKKKV